MDINKVLDFIQDVPDYKTFMTVDELNESNHQLAEKYPDTVEILSIGESRAGEKIEALKIGSGSKNALLFAMPHPNEPIGSMMLEFLSAKLAEDAGLCEEMDYTWYIVKCIDVDGTRLNEGWFKGPYSISNYALNYYRPPSHEQVEWTFPVEYKELKFDEPLPETKALMKLIEEHKPDFMFSLHNSGFGGVYLYLSHNVPEFYPDFEKLVKSQDLPLHLGEPEVPYVQKFSDAVFGMIGIKDSYDFMVGNGVNPKDMPKMGASSYEYACLFGNPFFLVCEMPYFYNASIHDTSPSDMIRRDAVKQNLEDSKEHLAFLSEEYKTIEQDLTIANAFRETISTEINSSRQYIQAQENWANSDPSLSETASVAEKFDNVYVSRFYGLLSLGTYVRMIETQIKEGGETDLLKDALITAKARFAEKSSELEKALEYQVIPIQKLVRVQLGCALLLSTL